jgi:phage tail P2-like protein
MPEFVSLLPPNSTPVERAVEHAVRLDLPSLPAIWHPQLCPPELLAHLAWSLSVQIWRDDWPLAVKRAVCEASLPVHARAGTVAAVRDSLAALGLSISLTEWWQPGGSGVPFTFALQVDLDGAQTLGWGLSLRLRDEVRAAVEPTKPARAHYTISARDRCDAPAAVATGVRVTALWQMTHDVRLAA